MVEEVAAELAATSQIIIFKRFMGARPRELPSAPVMLMGRHKRQLLALTSVISLAAVHLLKISMALFLMREVSFSACHFLFVLL